METVYILIEELNSQINNDRTYGVYDSFEKAKQAQDEIKEHRS